MHAQHAKRTMQLVTTLFIGYKGLTIIGGTFSCYNKPLFIRILNNIVLYLLYQIKTNYYEKDINISN